MNATQTLERAALAAHRAGWKWNQFWDEHGGDVCRAEPHNRQRFQRLVRRLLSLVASGDTDGMEPAGAPWLDDDHAEHPKPADVGTVARIDWTAAGVTTADQLPHPPGS